jgi:long-chain acyl-CoA synthetase
LKGELYPEGVPIHIKYPEIPIYSFLENSARKFPNRPATLYYGASLTYGEIWQQTKSFAANLKKIGIQKGDRVGVLLPNTPQFLIAFNAIHYIGGVVVILNPLMSKQEISRELDFTDCNTLVILDRLLVKLKEKRPKTVIVANATNYAPLHLRILGKIKERNFKPVMEIIKFEDFIKNTHPKANEEKVKIDAKKDVAVIIFTSGTTSQPKGVMLTHYGQVANALQSYHWLRGWGYSEKPQSIGWPLVLCVMPFFHSYGLVIMNEAISFGCTLVLLPNPNPKTILKVIEKYKVTHFPLIPHLIRELLSQNEFDEYDLTSLTTCASGGAYIPPNVLQAFEKVTGARIYQGYGLTEAGPSVCATPIGSDPDYTNSGLSYPDTEVKIVDLQSGHITMPHRKEGEIIVKGPQLMKGYWKDPEATVNSLREGWLFTGDIGYKDEKGYIYIVGRKSDRIIAAGHTIWPINVEEVLQSHPSVRQAVALGIPDPLRCSTDIHVIVAPNINCDLDELEKTLLNYCKEKLKEFEVPINFTFKETIPITVMGKVDRMAMFDEIYRKRALTIQSNSYLRD